MSAKKSTGSFDFLFGEVDGDRISEAGSQARRRLESDRLKAALEDATRAERQFKENPCAASAYELGECYQQLIEIHFGREHLAERKAVKHHLLKLLRWMKGEGIEMGGAEDVLKSLEIEFYYRNTEEGKS
jgi:hypothetical protein